MAIGQNFFDVLAARYASVEPTGSNPTSGDNATNWRGALSTAVGLRTYCGNEWAYPPASLPALDAKILAVLDAISSPSFCSAHSLETVEAAIEDLRTTAYAAAVLKKDFDSAGGLGAFSKFRTACRRCYGGGV
jgi:hypothetical protein